MLRSYLNTDQVVTLHMIVCLIYPNAILSYLNVLRYDCERLCIKILRNCLMIKLIFWNVDKLWWKAERVCVVTSIGNLLHCLLKSPAILHLHL